jgi:hypothetical protein
MEINVLKVNPNKSLRQLFMGTSAPQAMPNKAPKTVCSWTWDVYVLRLLLRYDAEDGPRVWHQRLQHPLCSSMRPLLTAPTADSRYVQRSN